MGTDEPIKLKGKVVARKANYLIVDIQISNTSLSLDGVKSRLLCTVRRGLIHRGVEVHVGDDVVLDFIDWNESRAVIVKLEPRKNLEANDI